MGMKEDGSKLKDNCTIDDFYNSVQSKMIAFNKDDKLCYITSRSTEDTISNITIISTDIKSSCRHFCIPTEGIFLKKTPLTVKAFKYLICNTNFDLQSLLADDTANGHLVDMQPPFSVYLLIEILWHCNFEDILVECILHFPLDICLQILEVLPRCIDLLDFERATKFLSNIMPNVYKKLIILRDTGSQTQDVDKKASIFAAHATELILQFMNMRFLKFEDVLKTEQYKRHGTILKSIIQMVRYCFTSKSRKVEFSCEMEKLYKLTFGHTEFHKIDNELLQKLLTDVDRELISLLLKKVKEIDCNIYLNWTEYDDEDNTAITLQRAIGLECYFFIENTKELVSSELKDYEHLIECLSQLASKPDSSVESMQLEDLAHGVREDKKECLIALFRRYKEWDDSIIDVVDSHISLLTNDDCEGIFEYLANEMTSQSHPEKLQSCLLCLSKALVFLEITKLYEITIKFILKFGDNDNLENIIDITNFERFISLNPNISNSKNLRVVLFFLCLKPRAALKILVKMVIGHSDYPDVAVSIDDLLLLEPVMKIQTYSRYDTLVDALRHKCSETATKPNFVGHVKKPATVSLVVRILQDICLDAADWNINKFANLLQALYTFCKPSEFVREIFVPFLLSDRCTIYHLKYTLMELQKLENTLDEATGDILYNALSKQGVWLLTVTDISRYIIDECLTIIKHLIDHLLYAKESFPCNYYRLFLYRAYTGQCNYALSWTISQITSSYQGMVAEEILTHKYPVSLFVDDVLRFMMTKCTKKQYLEYAQEMITTTAINLMRDGSKALRCDWIIRLTLEACLLCLEFPLVAAPDSVSFLIRCLLLFLSTVVNSQKKINDKLCESLDKHLEMFKPVVQYTAIPEAFTDLVNSKPSMNDYLAEKIKALEVLALKCTEENEKLKTFDGPNSALGIKLYLNYDIVSMTMNENNNRQEEYIRKLGEYFNPNES